MAPLETYRAAKSPHVVHSHFTHVPGHPLTLVDIDADFECDGCNGQGHGRRYRCSLCNSKQGFFDLHERCATCPSTLSCDFHPHHTLTLVVSSHGDKRRRPCALCGDEVVGLHYTCSSGHTKGCTFNIHPLCTELPASVHHAFHPNHLLTLQQTSSVGRCLACGGQCCDPWRYRCAPCRIDAHLECAFGQSPPAAAPAQKAAAVGHPAAFGAAVGWCPQTPLQPPTPQPMVLYYQNGCFYVAQAAVANTYTACSYNLYQQQPLYNNNNNYFYEGQPGNCNYGYQYYQAPGGQQQQQQQQVNNGGISSTSNSSGNNNGMKRICYLVGRIALKTAVGAATGLIW